jgi:hypothetical protein
MNSPRGFIDRMKDPSKINELLSMLKHFSVLTQSTQLGFQPPKSPHLKRTAPNIIFRLLLLFLPRSGHLSAQTYFQCATYKVPPAERK